MSATESVINRTIWLKFILPYLALLRPRQWSKNLLVLLPSFFDGRIWEVLTWPDLWIAFLVFCLGASALYALNDAQDASADRIHPDKSQRPVATGEISPKRACLVFALLSSIAMALCLMASQPLPLLVTCIAYLSNGCLYALWGRTIPVLDIFMVSSGFLLRIAAGSFATEVASPSSWLFICAFLMALLLSSGKRHSELVTLGVVAASHRASLVGIGQKFMSILVLASGFALALSYTLYAFIADSRVVSDVWPWATTPIALFLIGYYMKVTFKDQDSERPHLLWYRHKPIFLGLTSYFAVTTFLLYFQA